MQFRKSNYVKLKPDYPLPHTASAPVWGGKMGYILGIVSKTLTHNPDKTKHSVEVRWSNGIMGEFFEHFLERASEDDKAVSHDFVNDLVLNRDVWVLLRNEKGDLHLNMVETNVPLLTHAQPDAPQRKFSAMWTRTPMKTVVTSTESIVNEFMSSPELHEERTDSLLNAVGKIHELWSLPIPEAISLPMPEFESISFAAATAPSEGAATLMFHLPKNLADYAVEGNPS